MTAAIVFAEVYSDFKVLDSVLQVSPKGGELVLGTICKTILTVVFRLQSK
ncbi:hypothetical protein [Formosa algae]|uniref:Uncharacterized protein n=1 Tax=Formosa algae TaxID=225843 RepID=A0A9X0YK92_9FLAO|nr:hypothetical protein [Formosa algae]MBP1840337.1 hypothetical protein [Formosa algae]MDQ0334201.1 hypothetical protein [Formosa algae]